MTPYRSTALAVAVTVALTACASDASTITDVAARQSKAGGGSGTSVVMRGLNAPRGLAFGPEGALYVAEAGTSIVGTFCVPLPPRSTSCFSGTGSISRLFHGEQSRIVSGLPSTFDGDIGGPSHIDFQGRGNGYVTIGLGAPPDARSGFGPRGAQLGTLVRFTPNGAWSVQADLAAAENADPDNSGKDSNPYGVLAEPGVQYATDAGGNSLLKIVDGAVSVIATFPLRAVPAGPWPPVPFAQAVPTEVRRGPDGALYVSTLTGFPFVPFAARIFRVVEGSTPTVYIDGLTQVTDFAFGGDGSLYATQYGFGKPNSMLGSVVKVTPAGVKSIIVTGLTNPTGIIVGPDGALYISNRGAAAATGEVLRVVP